MLMMIAIWALNNLPIICLLSALIKTNALVGEVTLSPDMGLANALADKGAIAAPALLAALDLNIGDTASLGETTVTIRASLTAEPDQSISFVGFGPRLIIGADTLKASGLQQEGAFISYKTRLRLQDTSRIPAIEAGLAERVEGSYVRHSISYIFIQSLLNDFRRLFFNVLS